MDHYKTAETLELVSGPFPSHFVDHLRLLNSYDIMFRNMRWKWVPFSWNFQITVHTIA